MGALSILSYTSSYQSQKKAQTEVFSLIMITGVIITLVSAAYVWGVPLIEKQTTSTQYNSAVDFVLKLDRALTKIANTGSGEEIIDIPFGAVEVIPFDASDPDNNSLVFQFAVNQPLAFDSTGTNTFLGDTSYADVKSETGVFGEANPSVISLSTEPLGTGFNVKVKIHERTLVTPPESGKPRGFRIAVETGSGQKEKGSSRLAISFDQNRIQPGAITSPCCGDRVDTIITVAAV